MLDKHFKTPPFGTYGATYLGKRERGGGREMGNGGRSG